MKPATTLTLVEPIEYGEETVTTLAFKKPVSRNLRRFTVESLSNPSFDQLLDLAADLCAQPPELIDRLGVADGFAVINVVSDFLLSSSPTRSTEPLQS